MELAQSDEASSPFSLASVALPGIASRSGNADWKEGLLLSPSKSLLLLVCPLLAAQSRGEGGAWLSVGRTLGQDCQCSLMSLGEPLQPSGLSLLIHKMDQYHFCLLQSTEVRCLLGIFWETRW